MWLNTRYDKQNYGFAGLNPEQTQTYGNPLTVSGEQIMRNGKPFYIVGYNSVAQTFGAIHSSQTAAVIDNLLDRLVGAGINSISVMQIESFGLVISGSLYGRPIGCWDVGFQWTGGKTWTVGQKCYTIDQTSPTRVIRTYMCDRSGAGSTGNTGPQGTDTTPGSITDGSATWHFLAPAYTSYNEAFFAGDGVSAGFDYFIDACGKRGIYVMLRYDRWDTVYAGINNGYTYNGGGVGTAAAQLQYRGSWQFDGQYGTLPYLSATKAHLGVFLDRINTVNGRRYGDDPTIFAINTLNEAGIATFYYNTGATTGTPTASTFDYMCATGSAAPGPTQLVSTIVAAWDSAWLAWFQPRNGGQLPSVAFPGKLDTLPTYAYTGAMGPNVAARQTYRNGTSGDGYTIQVAQFLSETEGAFFTDIRNYIKSKSSYALHVPGQVSYLFPDGCATGDLIDNHTYPNATSTNGNVTTVTVTAGATAGMTWVATGGGLGTLTIIFNSVPSPALFLTESIRVTQTTGGSWTNIVIISTIFNTPAIGAGNNSITAVNVPNPITVGGTLVSASVILPSVDNNAWAFSQTTPNDTATTSIPWYSAYIPGESNYTCPGWPGNTGFGPYAAMRDDLWLGMPATCTELGEKAVDGPIKGLYRLTYTLIDVLQGGSGSYQFATNNGDVAPIAGEHNMLGDGATLLDTIGMSLIAKNVTVNPTYDIAYATPADVNLRNAKKNTTEGGTIIASTNGQTCGYAEFSTNSFGAMLFAKTRFSYNPTVSQPSTATYGSLNAGATIPGLTNPATGRLYFKVNTGYFTYENSKCVLIIGRIPSTTVSPTDMTKMSLNTPDGQAWYGRVMWMSLDGTDLGVGRSVLLAYQSPRDEAQVFRSMFIASGQLPTSSMLNGDAGPTSDTQQQMQTGVIMRNTLRVKLSMPSAMPCTALDRIASGYPSGQLRSHPSYYLTGTSQLLIIPERPQIFIG